jgi:cytochrome c oxidase assembly factor CtaG
MTDPIQSILDDWQLPIWLTLLTVLTSLIYVRGWFILRRTRGAQFNGWRLGAFLGGMASLWLAVGSPMDGFADALLSAHMVEHLILMSVVPPLVLLGLPVVPLLRGLPAIVRKGVVGPLLRFKPLRSFTHWLVRPRVAWLAMNITFLAWHVPAAYDFALENEHWHDFEHICFLFTSLLFWWCIVRPWPAARRPHSWGILLYLVGADLVNTALSAFLAFCNRPVYAYYVSNPNPFQISPLPDQVLGAALMWVAGSMAFLIPAIAITYTLLQPGEHGMHSLPHTHQAS